MTPKQNNLDQELIDIRKEFLREVAILQKEHQERIKQILKKIQLRQIEELKKKINSTK